MGNNRKTRVIGLDAGTNSLGWAIVDRMGDGQYVLVDKGVNIFQEGVKIEQGVESSRAADRTEHRALRKHYWRRKIRKIELLRLLSEYGLCPTLSNEELKAWRKSDQYPVANLPFMEWQGTDEHTAYQPYALRHLCVSNTLDMSERRNRWMVGRALYHIAQRRGFLSNRKEQSDADSGKVKDGISDLNKKMQETGCQYLCDYFYLLYQQGERIRSHYTDREEHYEKEFNRICELQQIDEQKKQALHHAIFYQRPPKSQKMSVGKCPFESAKTRCAESHPLYEDFRMWSFIRNIKIQTPTDANMRPLNEEEVVKIQPLFYRGTSKSPKHSFLFEDIAKALAPKKQYGYYKDTEVKPYLFNYHMDTSVSMSEVNAQLRHIWGEDWTKSAYEACQTCTRKDGEKKTLKDIVDDIWQALSFYDNDEKLMEYSIRHFGLNQEQAMAFTAIHLPKGYASLSLKAIQHIIPLMRDHGMIYPHATFLAKVQDYLPAGLSWDEEVENTLKPMLDNTLLRECDSEGNAIPRETREANFRLALSSAYGLTNKQLDRLYHPSMIEVYSHARKTEKQVYQLGSPRVSSVKNPMAMHSLFRMRKVLNELLSEGQIDENTIVHIEFARALNDANRRRAIQLYQHGIEKKRQDAEKAIQEGTTITHPTETDIQKYLLWKEQGEVCVYTGKNIGIADLFDGTKFDIEHTIPRSIGGCSTRANLTICDSKFNREIKRDLLPSQLANHEVILERIADWKKRADDLDKLIRRINTRGLATKSAKDSAIQKRHKLELERDYWREKYRSFELKEQDVTGFTRRQGTDISVINKYAKMYLQSVFERVDVVKGVMTAAFRKEWGLQDEDEKKNRDNHAHHCIDAITIACMGRYEYSLLSQYYHQEAMNRRGEASKPHLEKPWPTFTEDLKALKQQLIIAHHTDDNMPKHTRKRLRNRNGIVSGVVMQGDTARGPLHIESNYGAILNDEEVRYVVRKLLDDKFDNKNVKNIVDPVVRKIVDGYVKKYGSVSNALAQEGTIWMNKEKQIPIRHVRIYMPTVTRPNHIRQQRDLSKHEYKRQYHVMSDTNYCMAIYEGKDEKGKLHRDFQLVSNLEAATFFRRSQQDEVGLVAGVSDKGYPLKMLLKKGTMVLLCENSPEEIWELTDEEKGKRLYKVTGINSFYSGPNPYGRVEFTYHLEARPSTDVKAINGAYCQTEDHRAKIVMLHTQIKCLVEGSDFTISETGKIRPIC